MNSTSKAQIQQTFVFILFIIVAGFIILLGYRAITGFTEGQCDAKRLNFEQDMERFFDRYDSFGEVQRESVELPCNVRAICFVNSSVRKGDPYTVPGSVTLPSGTNEQVLKTAADSDNNIFLIGEFTEPAGYSEKVRVPEPNVLCTEGSGGRVNLVFRGQGDGTLVEQE